MLKAIKSQNMPYIKQSVTGFSLRRPGFNSRVVNVGFVVNKVEMGQVFLQVLWFSLVNPPMLQIHLSVIQELTMSPSSQTYGSNTGHYLRENS
jgi:hypothetical protein